ncbi:MAG TPA: acylphosphatase [Pseudomonadales bacterium]|nr:acylphosphatase [Pseudomonadales bacterium]
MTASLRVHGVVSGRVQGVGFRASLARRARDLEVRGWVRNRDDGSVEFLAVGAPSAVEALLAWAHDGPAGARVDGLVRLPAAAGPAPDDFEVRR